MKKTSKPPKQCDSCEGIIAKALSLIFEMDKENIKQAIHWKAESKKWKLLFYICFFLSIAAFIAK